MKKTLKSGYKGYKAYQFLEPGVDYTAFELAAEGNEFGEYIIDLTPEQEEFYEHVIAAHPMISLHEHPFCFPKHIEQTFDQVREGRSFTAYRALAESTWDCVFDNLMDGCCMISSKHGWKWNDVIYDLGMRLADIAHQDFLIKCERWMTFSVPRQRARSHGSPLLKAPPCWKTKWIAWTCCTAWASA